MTETSRGPDCPDDATLLAFVEGSIAAPHRADLDAHLDRCPSCLALLAALGHGEAGPRPRAPERYELRDEVGAGGMGQVFEAFDTVLGRLVALKCVRAGPQDQAAARRFEREMALTARLQHPSIIPVYDAGMFPDGGRYFAMRLVEGQTLDDAIARCSSDRDRLALVPSVRRACEAVAYAHGRGVIHRDLKPTNVLIGPFGETVVLDWGLAKVLGDDELQGEDQLVESVDPEMTRPGAVMGTPGYIAPEVVQGQLADGASDVFSLGRIVAKLLPDGEGVHREVAADLRAIVRRATQDAPQQRYASAAELCDDLRRFEAGQTVSARDYSLRSRARRFKQRHRRAIALSAIFVAVGSVGGLAVATALRGTGTAPCSGAQQALAEVWDDAHRRALRAGFEATQLPYADAARARAEGALDDFAASWTAMHTDSCEATARGEQSAELLDLRMACLDRAKVELRAIVGVLGDADASVVERSDAVVAGLPQLHGCEDLDSLQSGQDLPAPGDAARVHEAREALARVDALRAAARFDEAAADLALARAAAGDVEFPPLLAEVALAEGSLASERGEHESAEAALVEAMRYATMYRHRDVLRNAVLRMMRVVGVWQSKPDDALRLRPLAEGLCAGDPLAEAELHDHLGGVLDTAGDYQASAKHHRAALELRQEHGDRPGVTTARNNLAIALQHQGDLEGAHEQARLALEDRIETLGPGHPTTAATRKNLANVLNELGRYAEAEHEAKVALEVSVRALPAGHRAIWSTRIDIGRALSGQGKHDEAVEVFRTALGEIEPDNAHVLTIRHNLATTLVAQRKLDEARLEFESALDVLGETLGAEHPRQVPVRIGLAAVSFYQDDFEGAEAQFRRVLEIQRAQPQPNPMAMASAHTGLGQALSEQGQVDEAIAQTKEALRLYEDALEPTHPLIASTKANLGEILLGVQRPAEAREMLEASWALRQGEDVPAESRGISAYLLAQALWAEGTQRQRARELAAIARTAFADAGEGYAEHRDEVDAWLAERR